MTAVASQDLSRTLRRDIPVARIDRNENAAIIDPALIVSRVVVANTVILEKSGQTTGKCSGAGADCSGSRNCGTCDCACCNKRADAWNGQCSDSEQRPNPGTAKRAFDCIARGIAFDNFT